MSSTTTKTWVLNVSRVSNGWVVGCGSQALVVSEDQNLAEVIAATLVSERLVSQETVEERYGYKLATDTVSAGILTTADVHISTDGTGPKRSWWGGKLK